MKQVFNNIQKSLLAIAVLFVMSGPLYAKGKKMEQNDRQYWCSLLRHAAILERMISPEGALPVFGRSITYRLGCLQALSLAALQKHLPEEVSEAQVRCGLTAVMKRMFKDNRNFNSAGYLTLGYNGSQPGISDVYTNGGSLYMTTLAFLPLGLSADDSFWTSAPEKWTSKKAWDGDEFPKDHAFNE